MSTSLRVQIALFIYVASLGVGSLLCWHMYASTSAEYRRDFIQRYEAVAATIASTFSALELAADTHAEDALRALYRADEAKGPLTKAQLEELRDELGVAAIYIYGQEGEFISWTREPSDLQFNAFDICTEYGDFFTGLKDAEISPFVPALPAPPAPPPTKFAKRTSSDGRRLLQVVIYSQYVADALAETQGYYEDIVGSGLFAPNGQNLGPVASSLRNHEEVVDILSGSQELQEDRAIISVKRAATQRECCQCLQKGLTPNGKPYEYDLRFVLSTKRLDDSLTALAWRLVAALGCAAIAAMFSAIIIANHLIRGLNKIRDAAGSIVASHRYSLRVPEDTGLNEVRDMARSFNSVLSSLESFQADSLERQREALGEAHSKALFKMSTQVAHDIRSPLAALEMVVSYCSSKIDEESRLLMREATHRITDIANNLLSSSRNGTSLALNNRESELIYCLAESVISAKRLEYKDSDLQLTLHSCDASREAFCLIPSVQFKRVLSNLLNNAADAISPGGSIAVDIQTQDQRVIVRVSDDGIGMSAETLAMLGTRGFSHGKSNGNGLGFFGAKEAVESWGGSLEAESTLGDGSRMTISLPRAKEAPWFARKIRLFPKQSVFVLDDDSSVANVWKTRLSTTELKESSIKFHIYSNQDDFKRHYSLCDQSSSLCLVDYEFLGSKKTGADLIVEESMQRNSYLVTSYYEDADVRKFCLDNGIKMIPKGLASRIKIEVESADSRRGFQ